MSQPDYEEEAEIIVTRLHLSPNYSPILQRDLAEYLKSRDLRVKAEARREGWEDAIRTASVIVQTRAPNQTDECLIKTMEAQKCQLI
jgi:hypothetical protein